MTLLLLFDLTGRAAGRTRRSHREVIHSKHFRAGSGISREHSLCFCSSQSQCNCTVWAQEGPAWSPGLAASAGGLDSGMGRGHGSHPGHGSAAGKEAEELWGQILSRDHLCAASLATQLREPQAHPWPLCQPSITGEPKQHPKTLSFSISNTLTPLRTGRSQLQLPPRQALLAPAAGPEALEHP